MAREHHEPALQNAVALWETGCLAPMAAWIIEDRKTRLERVSAGAAR